MSNIKKLSLADLVFAAVPLLKDRPFRLQPRTIRAKPMPTKQYDEGVVHYGSRSAYLEPPPKIGQRRVLNVHGLWVTEHFAIPQPWKRVTPKAVRPGRVRRQAAGAQA